VNPSLGENINCPQRAGNDRIGWGAVTIDSVAQQPVRLSAWRGTCPHEIPLDRVCRSSDAIGMAGQCLPLGGDFSDQARPAFSHPPQNEERGLNSSENRSRIHLVLFSTRLGRTPSPKTAHIGKPIPRGNRLPGPPRVTFLEPELTAHRDVEWLSSPRVPQ